MWFSIVIEFYVHSNHSHRYRSARCLWQLRKGHRLHCHMTGDGLEYNDFFLVVKFAFVKYREVKPTIVGHCLEVWSKTEDK